MSTYSNTKSIAGQFDAYGADTSNYGIVSNADSGLYAAGGIFSAQAASEVNTALMGTATGGQNAFGGEFIARSAADTSFGLRAYGNGGDVSVGGFFTAKGAGDYNRGVYILAEDTVNMTDGQNIGLEIDVEGDGKWMKGIDVYLDCDASGNGVGIRSEARTNDALYNYGAFFVARSSSDYNYGSYSKVYDDASATAGYAVYGKENNDVSATYAGYFSGDVAYTGDLTDVSDERVKTNIRPFTQGHDIIGQIETKRYSYDREGYPNLSLGEGEEVGILAQDLIQVFPEAVDTIFYPPVIDSTGNIIAEGGELLGINYTMLIPVLIQAMQSEAMTVDSIAQANQALETENEQLRQSVNELNTQVASMQASLTDMQTILNSYDARLREIENNCCESGTLKSGSIEGSGEDLPTDITAKVVTEETELYQNRPNPFREYTEFSYKLGQGGMVSLEVYNASGQLIETLVSENQESGQYKVDWNTSDVQPGVYLYALKINGLTWVKKAIRIP